MNKLEIIVYIAISINAVALLLTVVGSFFMFRKSFWDEYRKELNAELEEKSTTVRECCDECFFCCDKCSKTCPHGSEYKEDK